VLALIRGLGANLPPEKRVQFAKEVFLWAKMSTPDPRASPLDCYFDEQSGQLAVYSYVEPVIAYEDLSLLNPPLVQTVDMQRSRDLIWPWLQVRFLPQRLYSSNESFISSNGYFPYQTLEPFILVGPEGCGKTLLLTHCFAQLRPACSVATVHCSAQTTAAHVQAKLLEACGLFH
jgi:dynein heavy chain 2